MSPIDQPKEEAGKAMAPPPEIIAQAEAATSNDISGENQHATSYSTVPSEGESGDQSNSQKYAGSIFTFESFCIHLSKMTC